jgi:quinol monooxygenase YgiN
MGIGMELFIFARFHVRAGMEGEAQAVLRDQVKQVRNEPGCLAIDVFVSVRDPQLFYLHSRWIDQAAFDVHAQLSRTSQFVTRMESVIDHPFEATRSTRL